MKKILAIAPYPYLPYYSGGQKFIAQFLQHLGKEIDLTVITNVANDSSLAINYNTIPLLKKSFTRYIDRSLIGKISSIIKDNKFDTLIIEHPYLAWLAFALRKRTGIKVIIHTHNIEYQRFRSTGRWWWPILKYYEKRSYKKADALFFITPEDKKFAISEWNITPEKSIDLPFGIDIDSNPIDKVECNNLIKEKYKIAAADKIMLFTGQLAYKPNYDALKIILDTINPILLQETAIQYKIIICGKGLPVEMDNLKAYLNKNIIYAGFIPYIDVYYKAADIFLNPVQTGGGVKTKVVEAIAYGTTVVSTVSGATGIVNEVCGEKILEVSDNNWELFGKEIINNLSATSDTPSEFYNYYNWEKIIKHIVTKLAD